MPWPFTRSTGPAGHDTSASDARAAEEKAERDRRDQRNARARERRAEQRQATTWIKAGKQTTEKEWPYT